MKVDNFSINTQSSVKPSFGAVHPAKYYIKCQDGVFREVSTAKTVKSLQRKLVTWLNKLHHDSKRIVNGEAPRVIKSETEKDKTLRERLVRFFTNRDKDYAERNVVNSFYENLEDGNINSYIFTGNSIDVIQNVAKPLGQIRGDIRERKNILTMYHGVDFNQADKYLPSAMVNDESIASKNYFNKVKNFIKKVFSNPNSQSVNSLFEAYFIPHIKGKNIKYELVDAKFNGV